MKGRFEVITAENPRELRSLLGTKTYLITL